MSENATAATGRTYPVSTGRSKKGTTGRKGGGTKKGLSISSIVSKSCMGTTA